MATIDDIKYLDVVRIELSDGSILYAPQTVATQVLGLTDVVDNRVTELTGILSLEDLQKVQGEILVLQDDNTLIKKDIQDIQLDLLSKDALILANKTSIEAINTSITKLDDSIKSLDDDLVAFEEKVDNDIASKNQSISDINEILTKVAKVNVENTFVEQQKFEGGIKVTSENKICWEADGTEKCTNIVGYDDGDNGIKTEVEMGGQFNFQTNGKEVTIDEEKIGLDKDIVSNTNRIKELEDNPLTDETKVSQMISDVTTPIEKRVKDLEDTPGTDVEEVQGLINESLKDYSKSSVMNNALDLKVDKSVYESQVSDYNSYNNTNDINISDMKAQILALQSSASSIVDIDSRDDLPTENQDPNIIYWIPTSTTNVYEQTRWSNEKQDWIDLGTTQAVLAEYAKTNEVITLVNETKDTINTRIDNLALGTSETRVQEMIDSNAYDDTNVKASIEENKTSIEEAKQSVDDLKDYVDNLPTGTDETKVNELIEAKIEGLATEDYVDQSIENVNYSSGWEPVAYISSTAASNRGICFTTLFDGINLTEYSTFQVIATYTTEWDTTQTINAHVQTRIDGFLNVIVNGCFQYQEGSAPYYNISDDGFANAFNSLPLDQRIIVMGMKKTGLASSEREIVETQIDGYLDNLDIPQQVDDRVDEKLSSVDYSSDLVQLTSSQDVPANSYATYTSSIVGVAMEDLVKYYDNIHIRNYSTGTYNMTVGYSGIGDKFYAHNPNSAIAPSVAFYGTPKKALSTADIETVENFLEVTDISSDYVALSSSTSLIAGSNVIVILNEPISEYNSFMLSGTSYGIICAPNTTNNSLTVRNITTNAIEFTIMGKKNKGVASTNQAIIEERVDAYLVDGAEIATKSYVDEKVSTTIDSLSLTKSDTGYTNFSLVGGTVTLPAGTYTIVELDTTEDLNNYVDFSCTLAPVFKGCYITYIELASKKIYIYNPSTADVVAERVRGRKLPLFTIVN